MNTNVTAPAPSTIPINQEHTVQQHKDTIPAYTSAEFDNPQQQYTPATNPRQNAKIKVSKTICCTRAVGVIDTNTILTCSSSAATCVGGTFINVGGCSTDCIDADTQTESAKRIDGEEAVVGVDTSICTSASCCRTYTVVACVSRSSAVSVAGARIAGTASTATSGLYADSVEADTNVEKPIEA
ncbi:hypothetical protein FOIG_06892 [Fusarium odoratissimum NRRL 54006]|uniref:Uncharacterized protein n=1 Tax=Fusarium odoratissimum (strain NRRL 54006) TaxID=1089451 RepID=X0L1E7_FUSO5|nr:uncharacterized protein FOIG_06892 [Fusarium odoratissimum NRRL 54006]EXM02765.1 hypothetical protein FOIG_06892 [Fusarium odoratissimum NRRL 54006]